MSAEHGTRALIVIVMEDGSILGRFGWFRTTETGRREWANAQTVWFNSWWSFLAAALILGNRFDVIWFVHSEAEVQGFDSINFGATVH